MKSSRFCAVVTPAWLVFAFVAGSLPARATPADSQLVTREIRSVSLARNLIGTDPRRSLVVYLPPGYDASAKRYPVIYFLPAPFGSYRNDFDVHGAQKLFDRAIAGGAIGEFILVAPDLTTPIGCSWYVNCPVTGNWDDFVVTELVPYIDANFRTRPGRDSRGIAGVFMGGYGAIRFAMCHPDVFGTVYALHPVGTGSGLQTMTSRANWTLLANAKALDDVKADGFTQLFTAIFQAHLPNPAKPPLFFDMPGHLVDGHLIVDPAVVDRLRNNFLLEAQIPKYAGNLRSLRGFKFDWGRSDPNQDHVYSNQAYTHKLNEYGIPHEAEEYNGNGGDHDWGDDGRIVTELLPFFQRHLVFDGK
jgi:S-formylglutathione hydrolase FrmB